MKLMMTLFALVLCSTLAHAQTFKRRVTAIAEEEKPIRDMYYVLHQTFFSETVSCSECEESYSNMFVDTVKYPNLENRYSHSCWTQPDEGTYFEVHYNLYAWGETSIPEFKDYLAKHNGMDFHGQKVEFRKVVRFAFGEHFELRTEDENGSHLLHKSHSIWINTQYEDQIFPEIVRLQNVLKLKSSSEFLSFIGQTFGSSEQSAFSRLLPKANSIEYTIWVSLLLEDGQALFSNEGYGDERECGASGCFN
jgi:hypothetical protein